MEMISTFPITQGGTFLSGMDRLARIKLTGYSSHWNMWGEDMISPGASESSLALEKNGNSKRNTSQLLKTSQPGKWVWSRWQAGFTAFGKILLCLCIFSLLNLGAKLHWELCRFFSQYSLMGAFSSLSSPTFAQTIEPVMVLAQNQQGKHSAKRQDPQQE